MKKSSKPNEQSKASSKNKELSLYQNQVIAKDQIKTISQQDLKKDYEPISEMFKIEVSDENEEKKSEQLSSESNPFQLFKQQPQEYLFTKDNKFQKKPLKNGGGKFIRTNFDVFFKDLKKNSQVSRKTPVNTIVLARGCDEPIWPAKIIKVQNVKTSKKTNIILFKVDFINLNLTLQLPRTYLAQFTPQNIEKVKYFINDKKLFKALKIAQKMFFESFYQNNKKAQKTQHCQIIIRKQQFSSKISNQFKNDQKIQPINIVIETPRIKYQQFQLDQSSTDSDQQVKSNLQIKSHYKDYHDDQTQQFQQEDLSLQKLLQSISKDKKDFIKSNPKIEKFQVKIQSIKKRLKKKNKPQIYRVSKFFTNYIIRFFKKKNKLMKRSTFKEVFQFFVQPLQSFKIEEFQRYAYIIDRLIYICPNNEINLEDQDQDKQFIKRVKKILNKLYVTLRDYEGDNRFINGVKMLQLCKLKVFQKQVQKNVQIVN